MENIIFYVTIAASILIIVLLCRICGVILNYITRVGDVLVENQEKLADNQKILNKQIDKEYNKSKESSKQLSSYERGRIDDIILALRTLGNEKLISYTEEINFLLKIRNW